MVPHHECGLHRAGGDFEGPNNKAPDKKSDQNSDDDRLYIFFNDSFLSHSSPLSMEPHVQARGPLRRRMKERKRHRALLHQQVKDKVEAKAKFYA